MADFTIMPGTFHVRVNDGHSSEIYEIEAESPDEAMTKAAVKWAARPVRRRRSPSHTEDHLAEVAEDVAKEEPGAARRSRNS